MPHHRIPHFVAGALLAFPILAIPVLAAPVRAEDQPKRPSLQVEHEDGEPVIVHQGEASFYSDSFQGKTTASGDRFSQSKPTAASKVLPLGTKATVTNEENGKSTDVTINDRGPHVPGRVIDLSKKAARELDIDKREGTAPVRVEAKPSDQPDPEIREKVEDKAEQTAEAHNGRHPGEGSGSSR